MCILCNLCCSRRILLTYFSIYCGLSSDIVISLLIFVLEEVAARLSKVMGEVIICGIWEWGMEMLSLMYQLIYVG